MRININELRNIILESLLNAYDVLGVSRNASEDDIKKVWRTLVVKHHPDRNPNDPTAHSKLININKAKDRLLNPVEKFRYGSEFKGYEDHNIVKEPPVQQRQKHAEQPHQHASNVQDSWQKSKRQPGYEYNTKTGAYRKAAPPKSPPPPQNPWGDWYSKQNQHTKEKHSTKDASGKPRKASYKVYPYKGSRRVVRVGGKLFGTDLGGNLKDGGVTKFNSNDQARVSPENGRMKVSKIDSDHSQMWDSVDEIRKIVNDIIIEMIVEIAEK